MRFYIDFTEVEALKELNKKETQIFFKSGNIIVVDRSYDEVIEAMKKTLLSRG